MNNWSEKMIDEILGSLDGIKRAEAPAFFYTRLRARMEKHSGPERSRPWLLRPVFALAALLIVLLINAAVILKKDNTTVTPIADTENESFQSIAAEYNLNEVVSLTDLNQEK
jgi:hypothetical protein